MNAKIKAYLNNLYRSAEDLNTANIIESLKKTGPHKRLLDVGCWDGEASQNWINASSASEVYGIEPVKNESIFKLATDRGIKVSNIYADKDPWPFEANFFDCVVSNQVVEHLSDIDFFFNQAQRVLKPNGFLVTSTNNLSSLHNIGSLVFGFTPFDLTNCSSKGLGIGNPFALHKNESDPRGNSWTHKTIYTTKWLKDWQSVYGLSYEFDCGAGLYPFPSSFGKHLKLYSAFITIVCKKNET